MKNKYAWLLYGRRSWAYPYDEPFKVLGVDMKPVDKETLQAQVHLDQLRERESGMLTMTVPKGVLLFPNCCAKCRTPFSAEGYYRLKNSRLGICREHQTNKSPVNWYAQ